jgi:hypothetical protein
VSLCEAFGIEFYAIFGILPPTSNLINHEVLWRRFDRPRGSMFPVFKNAKLYKPISLVGPNGEIGDGMVEVPPDSKEFKKFTTRSGTTRTFTRSVTGMNDQRNHRTPDFYAKQTI